MGRNPESDRAAEEARKRLDLKRILEQRGFGPRDSGETWKKFRCPFCTEKNAGVVEHDGRLWFNCFTPHCRSALVKCKDEVGVLSLLQNLSNKEAWQAWLKEAGVWKEETRSPSVLPGTRARRTSPPPPPRDESDDDASPRTEPSPVAPSATEFPDSEPSGLGVVSGAPPASDESEELDARHDAEVAPPSPPSPPPPEEAEEPEPLPVRVDPLTVFVQRTSLLEDHATMLEVRRGLTRANIEQEGFRSSVKANRAILEALAQEFSSADLVESGLWIPASGSKPSRPNPLFYGLGNTGKKADDGSMVRGWVEPILIPYWSYRDTSRCRYLRPHKDAVSGHDPHLYVPRSQPDPIRSVMITEGEFKANAFLEAGIRGVAAIAIPGISMVREDSPGSLSILGEMWGWLDRSGAREVFVVFDNEDKSLRIPVRKKALDAEIWARYLAIIIAKKGYKAKVGRLPDEWREGGETRDGKTVGGKTDWDSALARFKREGKSAAEIRHAFTEVLADAVVPGETSQTTLFDAEDERIIQAGVAKKFYKPKLARGGSRELKVSQKIRSILERVGGAKGLVSGMEDEDSGAGRVYLLENLASAYRAAFGRYYVMKRCVDDRSMSWWLKFRKTAREAENFDLAFLADKALEGTPFPKSDYYVEPLYIVRRADGDVHRRCRLRNVHKESRTIDLGSELHSPVKFRERCVNAGSYAWGGNENDLQALREDVNFFLVGQSVDEVTAYGWHPKARMWLASDGAITDTGETLVPDEDGIIWRDGTGYLMSEFDREGEAFRMGHPKWQPSKGLRMKQDGSFCLADGPDDPVAIRELADGFLNAIFNTCTSADPWLALGSAMAYAVGPEFFAKEQWFPGLWVAGMRGSGKTVITRIFLHLFGLACEGGIALGSTTAPGILIAAQQYSYLPIWLDDYRPEIPTAVREVLRQLWDRGSGSKKELSKTRRIVQTNAIVTSEHTSQDSATRQRFVHLHMSEERRAKDRDDMAWFQATMPLLFVLFRYVLRNQKAFAQSFHEEYARWRVREDLSRMETRSRGNHGVAFAACTAFMKLVGFQGATFMLEASAVHIALEGDEATRSEGNISSLFREIMVSFKLNQFNEESGGVRRYFAVRTSASSAADAEVVEEWQAFPSLVLLFDAETVHSMIRERLRRSGRTIMIELPDLKQQMAAQPYWAKTKRVRLKNGSPQATYCWAIDLDRHPLGRIRFPTPEVEKAAVEAAWAEAKNQAQEEKGRNSLPLSRKDIMQHFVDPRAGDLYLIAQAVLQAAQDERESTQ